MTHPRFTAAFALILACTATLASAQSDDAGGWELVSVGGLAAQPGGRIAFSADGAVFGTTGCNRFNGSVVSAPGLLSFNTALGATRMACPGEMATQEAQVFEALIGTVAVAYDPVADRMTLIPTSGAAVLGFARDD